MAMATRPKSKRRSVRRRQGKPVGGLPGQPPKLTQERIAGIAAKIGEGSTFETACALNGVSKRAGSYWLAMARQLTEWAQAEGKPDEAVESPWPRLPAPLLIRFLRAVTRARAAAEDARIRRIEELSDGGQVIEERTEETVNEKTGVRRVVTVRRLTPGDWRGHFALLDRMDKLAAARSEPRSPTGARPPEGQGGKGMDFQEIVRQAYELANTRAPDPRALSPAS